MNKDNLNYNLLSISIVLASAILFIAIIQTADAHSIKEIAPRDRRSDTNTHQGQVLSKNNNNAHNNHQNHQQQQQLSKQQQMMQQTSSSIQNLNRCPSGWMWFNNKCWVTTQSRRDFNHAIDLCKKQYNSTLPTIHSEDENEFLRQNIDLSMSPIWLFARHNHQYNTTRWLDRTQVNYTRWDAGQPSDKSSLVCIKTEENWYMKKAEPVDGQTECVSFWEDAKWGTQVGCLVLLPVVCERKLTPISGYANGPNGTSLNIQQIESQQMNILSSANSMKHETTTILSLTLATLTTILANSILHHDFI